MRLEREDLYRVLVARFEVTGELPTWVQLWPEATSRVAADAA